jgi:hypothetical protein
MKTYVTSQQGNGFRVINLDAIAFIDFISTTDNPNTPERCVIYFINGDAPVTLDHPVDAFGLLDAMQTPDQGY